MATNTYPVPPNFPNGLNLDLLITEMPTVWPADVFPATYTANGRPSEPNGITTGTLWIQTARVLTVAEDAAALAHFQVHAGGTGAVGLRIAFLEDPSLVEPGLILFVVDAPRNPPIGGFGTVLFADGINWRRVSDDVIIV